MDFEERAENFRIFMSQLGYTRVMTGRWIEEVEDSGQGFPTTIYICPICGERYESQTNYCPNCGSRLGDEYASLGSKIIHCKDCRLNYEGTCTGRGFGQEVDDNDFCSKAERREE